MPSAVESTCLVIYSTILGMYCQEINYVLCDFHSPIHIFIIAGLKANLIALPLGQCAVCNGLQSLKSVSSHATILYYSSWSLLYVFFLSCFSKYIFFSPKSKGSFYMWSYSYVSIKSAFSSFQDRRGLSWIWDV